MADLNSNNPQYLRQLSLFITGATGKVIDLSALRIVFSVKRSMAQTPNTADIKVYNVAPDTAIEIQNGFDKQFITPNSYNKVKLSGGYPGNIGNIFQGDIKQIISGRESGTDTFLEILAGDGFIAYNNALTSQTIGAGATPQQQVDSIVTQMKKQGITSGTNTKIASKTSLPRGKVLFGLPKDLLRDLTKNAQSSWSIQNGQLVIIPANAYLPGEIIQINSSNGMVGSPQQTLLGVNLKCLLNPFIVVGTRIQLNEKEIQRLPINLQVPGTAAAIPNPINVDGIYFTAVAEDVGDTRGAEWYTNLVTIFTDPTVPQTEAVPVNYE